MANKVRVVEGQPCVYYDISKSNKRTTLCLLYRAEKATRFASATYDIRPCSGQSLGQAIFCFEVQDGWKK